MFTPLRWVSARCTLVLDASVSEKHALSIFRAGGVTLGSGGTYIGLYGGKTEGVSQSETYFIHFERKK
jgi:hypothetical protein